MIFASPAGFMHGDRKVPRSLGAVFDDAAIAECLRALIDELARCVRKGTDADAAATQGRGLSEEQVFEIITCAAIGLVTRRYNASPAAAGAHAGTERYDY